MMAFPTDFSDSDQTLGADYDEVTNSAISALDDRGFVVLHGLTTELRSQISKLALESHIREYCPRDCTAVRFADRESTKKWLSRGHAVFLLAKKSDDDYQVIGYGWSGPKLTDEVPGGETTFAVRLGKAGLGQKLSVPFSQAIVGATRVIYGASNMWLETWQSNAGAVHVYGELGFEKVAEFPAQRPTVSGQSVDDVRLFMKLP